ncbi:MAG TPA: hypothetical protein VFH48_41780 [Chloroflexota bacterium]|nr:hypothetical protein [Chloroflexota bacterium]
MHFELWDLETRNLLYDFDTLDEAVEAARELTALNPGIYPEQMALCRFDGDSNSKWLARGEDLLRLSDQQATT